MRCKINWLTNESGAEVRRFQSWVPSRRIGPLSQAAAGMPMV